MFRLSFVLFFLACPLMAQTSRPRLFVTGRGTLNAMAAAGAAWGDNVAASRSDLIVDAHDESIELTKDIREACPDVLVTLKKDTADFLVVINRESKRKRGALSKNSQVLVANKDGDVIWAKNVRKVSSAGKDVCDVVHSEVAKASSPSTPLPSPAKDARASAVDRSGRVKQ